jgi:fructosamine-3-kinase
VTVACPAPVTAHLAARGWGVVTRSTPVSGGCINNGQVLVTSAGQRLFLKTNAHAPPAMFEREAQGLSALAAVPGAPRVPQPILAGPGYLLLEYLEPAPPAPNAAAVFGEQLAALHAHTAPAFGFDHGNYLGTTPQPNPRQADGWQFFAQHRLLFQGRLARQRGLFSPAALVRLERLAARLRDLVPHQPASLLHGDLWSGNLLPGPAGHVCLIDPAAHFGWAEADLAMTALFGRLPEAFFSAYQSVRPLTLGWRDRFELYNLYHLLNHLNLFGAGYLGSVEAALSKYA